MAPGASNVAGPPHLWGLIVLVLCSHRTAGVKMCESQYGSQNSDGLSRLRLPKNPSARRHGTQSVWYGGFEEHDQPTRVFG